MPSKDADIGANSVDPDQTVPLGAVWSKAILLKLHMHSLTKT